MDQNLSIYKLTNASGLKYSEFKKDLQIKKRVILFDLTIILVMLFIPVGLFFFVRGIVPAAVIVLPAALWIGFWIASHTNFFHEASHFNLIPGSRSLNDLLANIFFTPFTGIFIKNYRESHWKHHLNLGTVKDTENSYFTALNWQTLIEGMTGVAAFKAVLRYLKNLKKIDSEQKKRSSGSMMFLLSLSYMGLFHLVAVICLYFFVSIYCAISWGIGFFLFAPFWARCRQILEHRSEEAVREVDYTKIDHGEVTKMFGKDIFSKFFGAAGFNGHNLHHMDPTVSYTRFLDLENFLMSTHFESEVKKHKTTYLKTFKRLMKQ